MKRSETEARADTGTTEGGRRSGWRVGLAAAGVAVGGLGAGILGISAYAAYRLSRPPRSFGWGAPPEGSYEEVRFPAADGLPLRGWFLPGAEGGRPLVLCHGFHTGRREMLPVALALRDRGHHVLLFDFRGHGESDGRQTSAGLLEIADLEGAVGYLLGRTEVRGDRAGVLGFSMGGAVALLTAPRVPAIGAVVADSAFATMRGVVPYYFRAVFPLPAFPFAPLALWIGERMVGVNADRVRPVDAIGSVAPRPVLLIHGTEDRIVPLRDAFLLYESAREPRELWTVAGAGHVAAPALDLQGYVERVEGFFTTHLGQPSEAEPDPTVGGSSRS